MILAILQARCSSTRLPGKVLRPLLGKPMILQQLERVCRSRALDRIVVATSTDASDDELVRVLQEKGIDVRRGSLDDVLSRFVNISRELSPDTVVRLTGDNPLADPDVIDAVVSAHIDSGADYTSNSRVRSFPYGLDVECMRTDALNELERYELSADEREHVTLGLYSRPERFSIHSVTQQEDHSDLRWTVDYPQDFEFVEAVYRELHPSDPAFGQRDVLELIARRPELRRSITDVPE